MSVNYGKCCDEIFERLKMTNHQEQIDNTIKELDEIFEKQKARAVSDPDSGEASILLGEAFIDGMKIMYKEAIDQINTLRRELKSSQPTVQEPPKELAEFKAEVIKDMRQTIRTQFQTLLSDPNYPIPTRQLQEELIKLDRKLVTQIASIRHELPERDFPKNNKTNT